MVKQDKQSYIKVRYSDSFFWWIVECGEIKYKYIKAGCKTCMYDCSRYYGREAPCWYCVHPEKDKPTQYIKAKEEL